MVLLIACRLVFTPRGFETCEQSVDEGAGLEQLCEGAEAGDVADIWLSFGFGATNSVRRRQVGPVGGNERTTTVG